MSKETYKQLFADPRDSNADECMVEEFYYSQIARHTIHILDQSKGTDLYGDPKKEPVYNQSFEIPIHIKLDPVETMLTRYGMDKKRTAMAFMSRKICKDQGFEPKIGDRIDFTYRSPSGSVINEHFIIVEMNAMDFQRQTTDFYTYTAGLERTHLKYQPNPPGEPKDPKPLALDLGCLKDM